MRKVEPLEKHARRGVGLMVLAVMIFVCVDSSAKWLILSGMATIQVVFARYLFHFIAAALFYTSREGLDIFASANWRMQLVRSLLLLGSTVFNFAALKYLPITTTTSIMFSGPIVVTILSVVFLKETVGIHRFVAVCAGFGGVLVIMQPWGTAFQPAMLLSLGALLCQSSFFIMTRFLAGIEALSTQQIWSSGVAVLALLPFALMQWTWPAGPLEWLLFVAIGLFAAASHVALISAHRSAEASTLAPVVYIQLFFATAAGIAIFNTPPGAYTLLGGLIIIASGLYIIYRERTHRLHRPVAHGRCQ